MASGKKLVIVESPTKAKKIGGYLGSQYTVKASVGHIRDLAQPSDIPSNKREQYGKFGVDVNNGFEPYYVIGTGKKKTVAELKAALKEADELYLATDEDREGEAIAWHLVQTLKPKVPVKRMVFHEITKQAIDKSLDQTRDVDSNMVDAQETRRVLDRLYGYELSPVLWRKIGPKLSAGRVQSVATRMIVERERERMKFVSAQYWDLLATVHAGGVSDGSFQARLVKLDGRLVATSKDFADDGTLIGAESNGKTVKKTNRLPYLINEEHAERLAVELSERNFTVISVSSKPYRRRPLPPFTTSTLQQTAGNQLSMGARQTMRAAQALYENGYITYMRTDSVTLSQEAIHAARQAVVEQYGDKWLSESTKQYATRSAGAQEAHECIRPAGATFRSPQEIAHALTSEQLRLYRLIYQRTLACQMADAVGSTDTVQLSCITHNDGEAVFQASGTVIEFEGFLRAMRGGSSKAGAVDGGAVSDNAGDGGAVGDSVATSGTSNGDSQAAQTSVHLSTNGTRSEDANVALPSMREGDICTAESVKAQSHATQPPARYTEASLVKALESEEIGRPSTYASIISTIMDRGYVYEKGRALVPSWLAFAVVKLLETQFPTYVDYRFTADMENDLDRIARGSQRGVEWLSKFYFGDGESGGDSQIDNTADDAGFDGDADGADAADGAGNSDGNDDAANGTAASRSSNALSTRIRRIAQQQGLHQQVAQLGDIDAREINTIDIGEGLHVRIGRYGPYLEDVQHLDSEGNPLRATLPDTLTPDELTVSKARELMETSSTGPQVLGVDPQTGHHVELRNGRFGPYVALVNPEDSEAKPKMASLLRSMTPQTLTFEQALQLLSLPRVVGACERADEKTGEIVQASMSTNNGRYGPYVTLTMPDGTTDNRSLANEDQLFSLSVEEAKALFDQPKYAKRSSRAAKPPLRELGTDPETGKNVIIKDGFYGAYITDGETNRTLPKQYTPESIPVEEAFALLAQKRAEGPKPKRRTTRAKSTSKTSKASGAKTSSKASATKSSTAKPATAKRATTKRTTASSTSAAGE